MDELSELERFHQAMHTIIGSVDIYRQAWLDADFSETAAEQMAVQFNWLIMAWPPANIDADEAILQIVPRVVAFRQAFLTRDFNEGAAEMMAMQYHWHYMQHTRASAVAAAEAAAAQVAE